MADPFTPEDRAALVAASAAVASSGLVVASSGNLSLRRGDHLLITPRRERLAQIDPADLVCVALEHGAVDPGHTTDSEPSSETPLHRAVYAAVPDAGAVVHTHSQFATVLSTLVEEIPPIHYVAATFGGAVRVAPYATFGSQELADNVAAALHGRTAALMANHGAIATAPTIELAVEQAQHLEWLASVYWHARVFGAPAILDGEHLDAVTEQSRTLRYAFTEGAA
jgi:L-fuculose-phosphate aldolase